MRKLLLTFLALSMLFISNAQEESKFGIKLSGFIRNDAIFNSRAAFSARGESALYLTPLAENIDSLGNDLNADPNFTISSLVTRIRGKITGPDAFGAKTSGLIEVDFYGVSGASYYSIRMRHALLKLDWGTTQLWAGQYWHPLWIADCYASTVSFGAGLPYNPLSRNPQIRFIKQFGDMQFMAAILSQGTFKNKGNVSMQKAVIPEAHAQIQYKKSNGSNLFVLGGAINAKTLVIEDGFFHEAGENTVSSISALGYCKIKTSPFTLKLWAKYGQNNDNMVMMGGYAMVNREYTTENILYNNFEYVPIATLTGWVDFHTNGKKMQYGLFGGYSQNLGAAEAIVAGSQVGRWVDVDYMYRLAPRVVFLSGKTKIGLELEHTSVNYGKLDIDKPLQEMYADDGTVNYSEAVSNLKFILSLVYSF